MLECNRVWIYMIFSVIMLYTIIAKKQVCFFVMIFFAVLFADLITTNAINEKNIMYNMEEKIVTIEGRLSKVEQTKYGYNLFLENVRMSQNTFRQILVSIKEFTRVRIGTKIRVNGKLKHFEQAKNQGNFDAQRYYMSLGIYSKVQAEEIHIIHKEYDIVKNSLSQLKKVIEKKIVQITEEKDYGIWRVCRDKGSIFLAVLLGNKQTLNPDIKNLYSFSGIAHILAISGLHISFVGMFVYSVLRKCFKFSFSAGVSIILIICFGLISGMSIATVRAIVMFILKLLGEVFGRTYDSLTAISAAGILLMIWNPFVICNSGFQMSFAAIIAIVIVYPRICNILQIKKAKFIFFSLSIGMVMNPIIAYNYFQLPTYSFLLNIIVVPLMSGVIISGVAGISGSFINIALGKILVLPGCVILEFYTWICRLVNKLPYSNVIVGRPSILIILFYYLILIIFLMVTGRIRDRKILEIKNRGHNIGKSGQSIENRVADEKRDRVFHLKIVLMMVMAYFCLNILIYSPMSNLPLYLSNFANLKVTFLDVGQGDGIFIRTSKGVIFTIDGGSTSVDHVGQYRMIPFLKSQRIKKIDYAIVTHADIDHISGISEMIEQSDQGGIKVKHLVLPDIRLKDEAYNKLKSLAYQHGVKVLYIRKGDCFQSGNVIIKCIYPTYDAMAQDRNDYSTVLSVTYGKFSMLLTGDISMEPEKNLMELLEKHYTVLKVAHHGSKYATSNQFLQRIYPEYSVISVGQGNLYGHPSEDTLYRLKNAGCKILRTDERGEITFCTDGSSLKLEQNIICKSK